MKVRSCHEEELVGEKSCVVLIVPATGTFPGPVSVKVDGVIEVLSITSLKSALMIVPGSAFDVPSGGLTEYTRGGERSRVRAVARQDDPLLVPGSDAVTVMVLFPGRAESWRSRYDRTNRE